MNECNENDDIINQLNCCDKNTKVFTLDGLYKLCKIVSVYDGDTCRAVFNHNGLINKWTIRMNGYDTPEIRPSRSLPNRDVIKKKAIESREYLKSLVCNENQLVYLKCGGFDKYGRLLGELFIDKNDTESINNLMIKNGYAYEYHGGTKKHNIKK